MDYSICIKEIKKECFGELWRNALENNLFSSLDRKKIKTINI
jgi:hypothetical protein